MLTTVDAVKNFRGIEHDNTQHDEELRRIIVAVEQFLERVCCRSFAQATVTEYFNGDDWTRALIVARPPIVSITNLWDDPSRVYLTPLLTSSYAVEDAEAGLIVLLDGLTFVKALRNIKVTYVGGFATIPGDLEEACIELVWSAREKGSQNLIGVRSRSIADGSSQYVNLDWPMNLAPIIDKYSLRKVLR